MTGIVVGVVVVLLLLCFSIAIAVIMIIRQRKKKLNKPKDILEFVHKEVGGCLTSYNL